MVVVCSDDTITELVAATERVTKDQALYSRPLVPSSRVELEDVRNDIKLAEPEDVRDDAKLAELEEVRDDSKLAATLKKSGTTLN
ncbi:hypothetical protein BU15DRAFT_77309 [Melanogaster broomeanus]|nr:hypothetical protein BU15DRAFT_77309 [Melanogaster broomeanus]